MVKVLLVDIASFYEGLRGTMYKTIAKYIKLLPERVRELIYFRLLFSKSKKFAHMFRKANLTHAHDIFMYDLVPGDIISGSIAFTSVYERKFTKEIKELALKGGVFVDVGANLGYFSLIWASANPDNKVYSLEAAPKIFTLLNNNIKKNNLQDRVKTINKAASKESGTVNFDLVSNEQTGWGGISHNQTKDSVSIEAVRIDQLLPDTTIDVLKIDVEGADTWVLYGCQELLKKKLIKRIYFEENIPRMKLLGIESSASLTFLKSLDYKCQRFSADCWTAFPACN